MKINDRIAEELEAKGFYRRAASRWGKVISLAETDAEREEAAKRRKECIRKARRLPVMVDNFNDVKNAANRTLAEMGINAQDEVWRNYSRYYDEEDAGLL